MKITELLESVGNAKPIVYVDMDESKIRGNICEQCSKFDMIGHSCAVPGTAPCCSSCGCILNLKVRSMSASCPDGKWAAFMSKDDEDKFKDSLE